MTTFMGKSWREPLEIVAWSAATCLAFLVPPLAILKGFVTILVILYHGFLLSRTLAPEKRWIASLPLGTIGVLAIQSLTQTIWYYLDGKLGTRSDLAALLAIILVVRSLVLCISNRARTDASSLEDSARTMLAEETPKTRLRVINWILFGVSLIGLVTIVRNAIQAATIESIRTPWPLLSDYALPIMGIVCAAFIISIFMRAPMWMTAIQGSMAIAQTTLLTPIIYRIGYGFDGFLHAASERVVLLSGTLHPKPFYYIGQYVFTTWLSRLFEIGPEHIDRWLVPLGAALLLPYAIFLGTRISSRSVSDILIIPLLPLGAFVATTPQGFAYLLGLISLILTHHVVNGKLHPLAPAFPLTWAIAVHPLAGLPLALVASAVYFLQNRTSKFSVIGGSTAIILAGSCIPLLFLFLSRSGGPEIAWNISAIFEAAPWREALRNLTPWIGNRFVFWPAWATLATKALPFLLFGFTIAGLVAKNQRRQTIAWLIGGATLEIAGIILNTTSTFQFLIEYERTNYADRLHVLALWCLIIAAIPGLRRLVDSAQSAPRIFVACLIIGLAATSTALAYSSLPRHDALVTGRGWSTSGYDVEAVKRIDRDAQNRPYVVLANQSVSAAAVTTLGFKRYAGDVFFYPIPTGGPLYELYLRLTYEEQSLDIIRDAAMLARAEIAYVVINDYWWNATEVSEALEAIADRSWTIGENKNRVFIFDLKKTLE